MIVTVQPDQCLLDIAIQYGGSATALMAVAQLNGMGCTDDIAAGQQLLVPDTPVDADMAAYFSDNGYIPATAINPDAMILFEGIGYWIIGQDFIVS